MVSLLPRNRSSRPVSTNFDLGKNPALSTRHWPAGIRLPLPTARSHPWPENLWREFGFLNNVAGEND
jgi:hypothetical protein